MEKSWQKENEEKLQKNDIPRVLIPRETRKIRGA